MHEKLTFFDIVKSDYDCQVEDLSDFIDTSNDEVFKNISALNYLPWIGKRFDNFKTLIVGESFYAWNDKNKSQDEINKELNSNLFLRDVVSSQGLLLHKDKKNHVFYRNIERLIYGKSAITEIERKKLWTSVGFHQFIQIPMETNRVRPTIDQYKESAILLKELCVRLKIDHCLFLGSDKKKFDSVKNAYGKDNFIPADPDNLRVPIGNTFGRKRIGKFEDIETNFIFVKHPSAYFNWSLWHEHMIK